MSLKQSQRTPEWRVMPPLLNTPLKPLLKNKRLLWTYSDPSGEESGHLADWFLGCASSSRTGAADACTLPDSVLGALTFPSLAPHWLTPEEAARTMNLKCHALTLVLPAVDFGQFQAYRKTIIMVRPKELYEQQAPFPAHTVNGLAVTFNHGSPLQQGLTPDSQRRTPPRSSPDS